MLWSKKNILMLLLGLFLICGFVPIITLAQVGGTPAPITFTPEVPIPRFFDKPVVVDAQFFGKYIYAVFVTFMYVVGVLAVIMVIWGGIKWVGAAGNPARINDARDTVNSAIIGVIIALVSVTLLNIINPNLTHLGLPDIGHVEGTVFLSGYNNQYNCYEGIGCPTGYTQTLGGQCGSGGVTTHANPGEQLCSASGIKGVCCRNSDSSQCIGYEAAQGRQDYQGQCFTVTNNTLPNTACANLSCGSVATDGSCVGISCPAGQGCYIHDGLGNCVKSESYYTFNNSRQCNGTKVWFTGSATCGQPIIAIDDQGKSVQGFGISTCPTNQYCEVTEPVVVNNNQCGYVSSATRCESNTKW